MVIQDTFHFDHEGGGNLEKNKVIQWFTDICKTNLKNISQCNV